MAPNWARFSFVVTHRASFARPCCRGFSSAIDFDAGLGQSADGGSLTLTQWLPGVASWRQAADALERLLNQVSALRAELEPVARAPVAHVRTRAEDRLRRNYAYARA